MIAGSPGTRDFLYAAIHWSQTHPNAWATRLVRRLRPDVGAGVDDPLQPVQGVDGRSGIRNALIVSGPAVKRPKAASTTA